MPSPTGTAADPRIQDTIAALHSLDPHDNPSAAYFAARVGLSASRFLRLFDHTVTSFRRYRLWLRMLWLPASLRRRSVDRFRSGLGVTAVLSPTKPAIRCLIL